MIAKNWFALEISRQDLLDNVDSTMKIQAINKAFQLAVMDDLLDTEQAVDTAVISGQPGATIGRVGVPHNPKMDPDSNLLPKYLNYQRPSFSDHL